MQIDREAIAATMFSYEHNEPWSESTAPARSHYLELADLIISLRKNGSFLPFHTQEPKNRPERFQKHSGPLENFSTAISGGR